VIKLDATTEVPSRPFTALRSTDDDLQVMEQMLDRLRRHIEELPRTTDDAERVTSRDDRFTDPSDRGIHRIVITDPGRVRERHDLIVVGFFGQARADVDHEPIVDLESALISDMAADANPLVYYNVHWPGVGWGNLVLFTDMDAKNGWGDDPRHAEAVERSPAHYHSIRLHVGDLPGGVVSRQAIELRRTRYFDFSGADPWTAVREIR